MEYNLSDAVLIEDRRPVELASAGGAAGVIGVLRDRQDDGPAVDAVHFGQVCAGQWRRWSDHGLT